jgi:transketolase
MRQTFVDTLIGLAEKHDNIVLLTADLGYGFLEKFQERFPNRFYNCGVAEQNMIGMSVGLAKAGMIPYCYSIASFLLHRPYEFIRNGICHHNSKVRLIGVGYQDDYKEAGFTHWNYHDVELCKTLNLELKAPKDKKELNKMLESQWNSNFPIYYRLRK